MNNNIASLLTTAYEIEGLLLVVSRHGNDTPSLVYERIKQAAAKLNEQCKELMPPAEAEPAPAHVTETQPVTEPEVVTHVTECEDTVQQVPVEDREPDEDIDFEFVYPEDDEPMQTSEQLDEDEPVAPFSFIKEKESEDITSNENLQLQEETDEKEILPPTHHKVKDIRSAFSINDKFRFRRELFENDDYVMNNALDLIMAMESAQEAENYFIDEMGWDANSEEVVDFMEIIRKYFA